MHNMRQDREETVRSFGAHLHAQAGICKFLTKFPGCNTDVNYTESVLRYVLTEGIADPEIQLDLLGSNNQDISLEEVFKFVESKEARKHSSSHLLDSHAVESTSNSYRKSKQTSQKQNQEPCSYCGKKGHGRSDPGRIRRGECPAYGHRCQLCSRDHHLELVCQSKNKQNSSTDIRDDECEGAIVNSLCTLKHCPTKLDIQLPWITTSMISCQTHGSTRVPNSNHISASQLKLP